MDIKAKRKLAKQIRDGLTTTHAECYRVNKLPKTATINNITTIIDAMTDETRQKWQEVFNTSLYLKDGSTYCNILAYINLKYEKQIRR